MSRYRLIPEQITVDRSETTWSTKSKGKPYLDFSSHKHEALPEVNAKTLSFRHNGAAMRPLRPVDLARPPAGRAENGIPVDES
jgi:hypothetical protein